MTHLYSKRWMLALFVLFPLLALSSYRSGAADATPEATATVGTDATAQGTPLAVDVDFGPGSFNLTAPKTGLADLSSYRATLILSFKGTKAGQPEAWSGTYVMLASQKPPGRQLTIYTTGKTAGHEFMAEVNGALYERQGENACTTSVIQKDHSLAETWEPAGFLNGVIGADAAASETVNGVASNHYTFDERAFGQQGIAQSKGELLVATDGGYIVKYILTTTGKAEYFGEGIEGTISWDYELTDVNQPVVIKLPADCPAGMVDAPLMPDAVNVFRQPGLLSYSTTASVADAAAFYQTQFPALGWQVHTEASITKDSALLDFTNGDQEMLVVITAADGKTAVRVMLGPAPEGTSVPTTVPTPTLRPTRTSAPTKTKVPTRTPTNTKTPKPTRTPAS